MQWHAVGGRSSHMALAHSQGHKASSTLATTVTARNGDNSLSPVTTTIVAEISCRSLQLQSRSRVAGSSRWKWRVTTFRDYSCREWQLESPVWTRLNAIKCGHKNPERAGWGSSGAGEREGTHQKHACHGMPLAPITGECSDKQ